MKLELRLATCPGRYGRLAGRNWTPADKRQQGHEIQRYKDGDGRVRDGESMGREIVLGKQDKASRSTSIHGHTVHGN